MTARKKGAIMDKSGPFQVGDWGFHDFIQYWTLPETVERNRGDYAALRARATTAL